MNHHIQFVNPLTGTCTHKYTRGPLAQCEKEHGWTEVIGKCLVNFMFRRRFNANAETTAMVNAFIGHLMVLGHIFLLKYHKFQY